MIKKLLREWFLLPRGEQRALVAVTLLLLLSLLVRMGVQFLPGPGPAGMEEFEREARAIMQAFARADSVEQARQDSLDRIRIGWYDRGAAGDSHQTRMSQFPPVDINRADSAQLLPLPGIGPVFAGRIIKFRNLLGGFVHVDQLAEVYGLPSETIERIRSRIWIDGSAIRKIRIDSASFSELLRHPYLDYGDVKALLEYREFKGKISTADELRENHVLPDSTINRIDGYIECSISEALGLSKQIR
jgi:DNA uptake protein ComE-like DNA-binding protein